MSGLVRVTPLNIDTAFDDLVRRTFASKTASWMPAADIIQDGEDVLILLDLPGMNAETLDMELKEQVLRITGTRAEREVSSTERLIRAEIRRGDFTRTFRVPSYITADAISAAYDNGVLQVRIRGAQPTPTSQKIAIQGVDVKQAVSGSSNSEEATE